MMTMASSERYARLEALPAIGAAGVVALRNKTVAVLGVGNIGGQLAQHLVLLGLNMVLVDRDIVTGVNLGTQGFTEQHIGRPKADARAERLGPLNTLCRIEPVHADIRRLGLGALRETAVLCSCLDNRASRILVNEIAVRLGIPWVDGALDGSGKSLFGRVACYDPRRRQSACYLCPYDSASLRDMWNEAGRSEGCSAQWWKGAAADSPPTLAVSALGGAVASMQAIWVLNLLLGQPDEIAGAEVYFDLGRRLLSTHRLTRNPRCLFDHQTWNLDPIGSGSGNATVAQTFAFAERTLGEQVALQLLRRAIVTQACCPHCGAETHPYRVTEAIDTADLLCNCGTEMHPVSANMLDRFGRSEADPFLDRTWAEIGLPTTDVVVAAGGGRELHLLLSEPNG